MKKGIKNKGFTLIELLAVIVILGVIIGLAFPAISRRINETRETAYSLHEADMKLAAANMMSECVSQDEVGCVPENGKSKTVYLSELVAKKYSQRLKDPGNTEKFCSEEESYVVVTNSTSNIAALDYEVCLVCSEYKSEYCGGTGSDNKCDSTMDQTKPRCGNVNGGSTLWTNKERVVSVECSDSGCGCTQDVFYKRFTETGEKGTITISDKAGNTEECEVNAYIDKDVPSCELEVIGTLGENGWYGNEAPIVRFKSKTDELSGIDTYGLGQSLTNYDFNKKDEYTVKEGITTVYGYVRDNAGNEATCKTEAIKYDPVKPTISNIRYGYVVYPKEDIATTDTTKGIINLNDITGEYGTLYGAYIYLKNNENGMYTTIKNGTTELSTRTISSGVLKMEYTFDPGSYNNISIDMGSKTNLEKVERIELLTGESNTNYFTNKDVTIYITSHDSYSGKAYYTFNNGTSWQKDNFKTYTTNQSSIVLGVKDHSGNTSETQTVKITNIDKIKPECTLSREGTLGVEEWYRSDIKVDIARNDISSGSYAKSDIRYYHLTKDVWEEETYYNRNNYDNTESKNQTEDTSSTYWYGYVIDKAGNTNTCKIETKKDTVVPKCEVKLSGTWGNNNWWRGKDVDLTLSRTDDNSGIYEYDLTKSSTASYNKSGSDSQGNTSGITWYGYVKDKAGNTGKCDSGSFKVDKTYPSCGSVSGSSTTWTGSSRTITQYCNDSGGSNCAKSSYSVTYSSTAKTGSVTIYDNAGNGTSCSYDVYVDKTGPTCDSVTKTIKKTTSGVTGYVTCKDSHSGCEEPSYSFSERKSTGNVTIKDKVGNWTSCEVVVEIQHQKKSCTQAESGTDGSVCGYNDVSTTCVLINQTKRYCNDYSASQCSCGEVDWADGNCDNGACVYCECTKKVAKTCANVAFGCKTWGSWTDASSCTYKKNQTECRALYY